MNQLINLRDLLEEQTLNMYASKKLQAIQLPRLQQQLSSPDLRTAVKDYLANIETQLDRMERIFRQLHIAPTSSAHTCMSTLLHESNDILKRCGDDEIADAAMINAIQHIIHYDMAGYGSACAYARTLSQYPVATLLHYSLEEDKHMDIRLSQLAEQHINQDAKAPVI
jgi:ferritin-like metal-binding protein YciE